jgi:hypothetical protein
MEFVSRVDLVELAPNQAGILSWNAKITGHPTEALIVTILGLLAKGANYFFEEFKYKCSVCGAETSEIRRRQ